MLELKIDSGKKNIRISFLPLGEKEPIDVRIDDYELSEMSGVTHFCAKRISSSREWMTVLASEFICGKQIALPAGIASKISKLIL